MVFRAV